MKTDLLLVIDMQNVYTVGQAWACERIETACTSVQRLLRSGCCGDVIFTRYLAPEKPKGVWKEYNRVNREINQDPWLNEILPELLPWVTPGPDGSPARYSLLTKDVYSAFGISEVRERACRAGRVVITGVVSECCVLSTVFSAIDEGCKIIYLRDAVAGVTRQADQEVEHILSGLAPLHLEMMDTEEYLRQQEK